MSRIFEAFEKVWERRYSRPLQVDREPATAAQPAARVPEARNGSNGTSKSANDAVAAPTDLGSLLGSARIQVKNGAPILPFDGLDSRASEQYKIVRTKILQHFSRPRCLVVSSAQVEDGKSVSAVNLAGCLALKDQTTVLLLDADMRRSRIADHLGVPSTPGLAEVLTGQCSLDKAIVRLEPFPNLYFLPKGERPANPAELLDSSRWRGISAVLRKEFGFVIIDAPPIGLVTDYDLLQDVADGVILIVRPDHTNRSLCLKALETIPPEKLVGVLINCAREWFLTKPLGYRYDYYYDRTD